MKLYKWSKDETVRTELYITYNTFHWMRIYTGECYLSHATTTIPALVKNMVQYVAYVG